MEETPGGAIIARHMIHRVLRVEALLALDADRDLGELHRRDHAIGAALPSEPAARVLGWAAAREATVGVQADDDTDHQQQGCSENRGI